MATEINADTGTLFNILIILSLLTYFLGQAAIAITYNIPAVNKPECILNNLTLNPLDNFFCGFNSLLFLSTFSGGNLGFDFFQYAFVVPVGLIALYLLIRWVRGI
jgi:hypothetical protein